MVVYLIRSFPDDRSDREERKSKRRHRDSYSGDEEGGEGSSNLEKASLSISESNAMRAKLGLKPLQVMIEKN